MSELMLKLVLDGFVAFLLAVTIFFCLKLNKRIKLLQDSKSELAQLIKQFDESTQAATASIVEIQRASQKINANIQEKLDKANYLADDLAFMIERGNKTADAMQNRISGSRIAKVEAVKEKPARTTAAGKAVQRASKRAKREEPSASEEGGSGIEAMMDRINELKSGKADGKREKRPLARMRTRSERELAAALKDKE